MCNMFQDHNLVAEFHRITRLNLRQGVQGIFTETANSSVTQGSLRFLANFLPSLYERTFSAETALRNPFILQFLQRMLWSNIDCITLAFVFIYSISCGRSLHRIGKCVRRTAYFFRNASFWYGSIQRLDGIWYRHRDGLWCTCWGDSTSAGSQICVSRPCICKVIFHGTEASSSLS